MSTDKTRERRHPAELYPIQEGFGAFKAVDNEGILLLEVDSVENKFP